MKIVRTVAVSVFTSIVLTHSASAQFQPTRDTLMCITPKWCKKPGKPTPVKYNSRDYYAIMMECDDGLSLFADYFERKGSRIFGNYPDAIQYKVSTQDNAGFTCRWWTPELPKWE